MASVVLRPGMNPSWLSCILVHSVSLLFVTLSHNLKVFENKLIPLWLSHSCISPFLANIGTNMLIFHYDSIFSVFNTMLSSLYSTWTPKHQYMSMLPPVFYPPLLPFHMSFLQKLHVPTVLLKSYIRHSLICHAVICLYLKYCPHRSLIFSSFINTSPITLFVACAHLSYHLLPDP